MFTIERVAKYKTSDGALHDDAGVAHNHELTLELKKAVTAAYEPSFRANRADSLLIAITDNPKLLRDLLTKYITRLRKTDQREAA